VHALTPTEVGTDLDEAIAAENRTPPTGTTWVALNMVTSVDGSTAVDGQSGALGGDGDRAVFGALRAMCDVVLVASGTAKAENYGPPKMTDAQREARRARGQRDIPRLAVVSRSLSFATDTRLFSGAGTGEHPLILTSDDADPDRVAALGDVAEVVAVGSETTPERLVAALGPYGPVVLCEGGPTLNGQFVAAGVIDELLVTLAPMLTLGDSLRLATGDALEAPQRYRLDRVFRQDDELFLRYLQRR
jgi:riboflavin biosynthesis pyrimidine reductase